jgi:hypothetical protein
MSEEKPTPDPSTCVEITTEQFLEQLHGPNAIIYWNVNGKSWKNKPSPYTEAKAKLAWRNELGDDIYFIVNTGGTKNADIVKINANYIDWDVGRDAEKRYFPLEMVEERKKAFRERLARFPLKPTFVVETRNGYQVYWQTTDCTKDQFVDIQRRLIAYFGSDKKVCNPNRVMRLPGYYWHKRKFGFPPFYVRVVEFNDLRYTASTLMETLPPCPKPSKKTQTAAERKSTPSSTKAITKDIHNICFCTTGGTFSCFLTPGDALDYLKQQNLLEYLQTAAVTTGGSSITVHCPFHTDETASASIFRNQSTGHWLLTCHSDHCDFGTGSIIEVACRQLGNVDPATAARHLMKHYGLRLDRQEWINKNVTILNQNIEQIQNLGRDEYPHLYTVLNRIRGDLVSKLRVAIDLIQKEPLSINFHPAFFFSLRGFEQRKKHLSSLPRYHNKQSKKIDRYCLLGLMHKLADDQIPRNLLDKAHQIQEEQKHRYRVQFYAFPHYTPELFRTADALARTLKERKVRLRGLSRGLILDVFGPEAANRVYPLCRNQPCVESSTALAHQVLDAMWESINRDGYTTLGRIAEQVRQEDQSWAVTLERVSRLLPGLLSRGGLKEVYATKVMKAQYHIDSQGYPRIIVRADGSAESDTLRLPEPGPGVSPAA